jgi:outer membrane protein assembly factor BamD (BamD/ComL family)
MQPISILLALFVGCLTLLTMTYALSINTNQENEPSVADTHVKRFYDFGSRSIHDDDLQEVNDEFNRLRRFYDFGTKKRFYDFGSKKKRSNE